MHRILLGVVFALLLYHLLKPKPNQKFLIIGSAPYMRDWVPKHLKWFLRNGYQVATFNNSWKLVPIEHISYWFDSGEHDKKGTFIPNKHEEARMNKIHTTDTDPSAKYFYTKPMKSTMLFNVLYHFMYIHLTEPCTLVVVGCDMQYTKEGDTFYSHLKNSKAANDPINRLGESHLERELESSNSHGFKMYNASTEAKTRLPYPRFRDHLS